MCIQNRLLSLIYRAVMLALCLVGVLPCLSFFGADFSPYMLLYYPILSTSLYAVVLLIEIIVTIARLSKRGIKGTTHFVVHFKGALILMLLANILMVQFAGQGMPPAFGNTLSMALLYFVVPIMAFLSWLLLDMKGHYRFWGPIVWMLVPFGYYGITLLAAIGGVHYYTGASYPYDFLNPGVDGAGWAGVLVRVVIIAVIFMAVGFVFTILDRILGRIGNPSARQPAVPGTPGKAVYTAGSAAPASPTPGGTAAPPTTQATQASVQPVASLSDAAVPVALPPPPGSPGGPAS
ncbi:MAG: Pr6Pr family membrane protein [Ruminococcaceae bacterium]|nr:Pr6Pr family membrane protein [Oscillospiraceae bacterium]